MRSLLGDVHGLELPPEVPPLLQEVDGLLRLSAHHAPIAATLRGAPIATPNQLATQSEIWTWNRRPACSSKMCRCIRCRLY